MKRKKEEYFPLKLAKRIPYEPDGVLEELCSGLFKEKPKLRDIYTEDGLTDFIWTDAEFCNPDYQGIYQDFNRNTIQATPNLAKMLNTTPEELVKKTNIGTEWRDILLQPLLTCRWLRNKQVYKPDPDFVDALLNTEGLQITQEQIEHLPCNDFCIDLSGCPMVEPTKAVMVHLHPFRDHNGMQAAFYQFTEDLNFFSFYLSADYENGMWALDKVIGMEPNDLIKERGEYYVPAYLEKSGESQNLSSRYTRREIARFAVQFMAYISSREPDIEESERSEKTYRPGTTVIHNRASEIREFETGVRFGKAIRTRQAQDEKKEEKKEPKDIVTSEIRHRVSPMPHFRRAHWSHYWTGKRGEQVLEARWIAPVFVGFRKEERKEERDIVITKVGK